MKKENKPLVFIISLIVVYSIAFLGSIFTSYGVQSAWYESIKPAITPPSYVFPIVWNVLFFLIALSLYFSWISAKNNKNKNNIALVFGLNFILNVTWSIFYFGMQNPLFAFFDIILLLISIALMIFVSGRIDKKAGWLLAPYLLWVGFASILNWLSI